MATDAASYLDQEAKQRKLTAEYEEKLQQLRDEKVALEKRIAVFTADTRVNAAKLQQLTTQTEQYASEKAAFVTKETAWKQKMVCGVQKL